MKRRISAKEYVEWAAFEEQFGPLTIHERVDYAASLISYMIASANSDKKLKFEDFVIRWGKSPKQDLFTFLKGEADRNVSNPRRRG